jgi:hypothetical protein
VPEETEGQRLNRELEELLQGLRVLLPGVQVLFAFLLTVPFAQRFTELNTAERAVFVGALVGAAMASALLVAPSAFHRILFRERDKEWLVTQSNRFAIAGTIFLAASMTCALYLVVEVIYGSGVGAVVAGAVGAIFLIVWYVVPLIRRARN